MTSWPIGSTNRPLLVAVVGTGPSGFFAAQALSRVEGLNLRLDLYDRLPTPFGLVRAGVAPDHPNIKAVARRFTRVAEDERIRFFGNVQVGRDVSAAELRARYDAVIYATGAEKSRRMALPGEDLEGVAAAAAFVYWYNVHPDYADLRFDLGRVKRAVVLGNGNVALDVARVLARRLDDLQVTDIADSALVALRASAVEEVHVLGRRGPAQAAFTAPELRELLHLPDVSLRVAAEDLELDAATRLALDRDGIPAGVQKNLDLLFEAAANPTGGRRALHLRFLTSPVEFLGDDQGRLRAVRLVRNRIEVRGGRLRAVPEGAPWEEPCELALKAIGYRGVPLPGLPFDQDEGVIPSDAGRIRDPEAGQTLPGQYVVGWARRGPSGVIGTNKPDAEGVVKQLLADLADQPAPPRAVPDMDALFAGRGVEVVHWQDWHRIDERERAAGEEQGRPRVKLPTWAALLAATRAPSPDGAPGGP